MSYRTIIIDGVRISLGNSKVHKTPNVSVSPIIGCMEDIPCTDDCYAMKAYRMYPTVKVAWDSNLNILQADPERFFNAVRQYCQLHIPKRFRFWVAGDWGRTDQEAQLHFDLGCDVARDCPSTRFTAFTKCHGLVLTRKPSNLVSIFSMWPSWSTPRDDAPSAWLQDGTETRIPDNALTCPGSCEKCTRCFRLRTRDVVFNIH